MERDAQNRLMAAYRAAGLENRDERLLAAEALFGRAIRSSLDLDDAEVNMLTDALEQVARGERIFVIGYDNDQPRGRWLWPNDVYAEEEDVDQADVVDADEATLFDQPE